MLSRDDNAKLNELEMRQGLTHLQSRPRIASIGLTLRCNLNCIMCFTQKMEKKDMEDQVFENAKQLFPALEEARWNDAGELFASRRCRQYLDVIRDLTLPKSYLSTNFQAAEPYMEDLVSGGFTHLSVSIDAATKETYESIRRGGKFDRLIRNLEMLHSLKQQRGLTYPLLTLVFVAMRRNIQELPAFVEMAHRFGAHEIHVLRLLPNPGEVEKKETISLSEIHGPYQEAFGKAQEFGIRLSHIAYTDDELDVQVRQSTKEPEDILPISHDFDRRSQFDFRGLPFCLSPWTEILIDVNGKIRPCCYHPMVLGDLNKESVLDIWNNDQYQEFRNKILNHDFRECHHCPWLHKVFHYHQPEQANQRAPLNQRFRTLEQGWNLDKDMMNRLSPFPDIKVQLDPLAYKLNKEWDLGDPLPDPNKALPLPDEFDQKRQELQSHHKIWQSIDQLPSGSHRPKAVAKIVSFFKSVMERAFRFHTGPRFEQQKKTNLLQIERMEELWENQQRLLTYLDLQKTFLDNQKNFNAVLVQYVNNFSDRLFDRIERQKDVNMEVLHTLRQTNERIDRLHGDNELILEAIQSMKDDEKRSLPSLRSLDDIFFKSEIRIDHVPERLKSGDRITLKGMVTNFSYRSWSHEGNQKVGVSYYWRNKENGLLDRGREVAIWLPETLKPSQKLDLTMEVKIPSVQGAHELVMSLITSDQQDFADFSQANLTREVHIYHDGEE